MSDTHELELLKAKQPQRPSREMPVTRQHAPDNAALLAVNAVLHGGVRALTPSAALALQRRIGNAALQHLLTAGPAECGRVTVASYAQAEFRRADESVVERQTGPTVLRAAPKRVRASRVTLIFVPDEKIAADGKPMGVIHVRVGRREVATFEARGGRPRRVRDVRFRGKVFAPTPAGRFTLGPGVSAYSRDWGGLSQLAWGTPIRDTGIEVQYRLRRGRWRSTMRLNPPLSRGLILAAEQALGKTAIPNQWNLNDFGKIAFQISGTKSLIHTTPQNEEERLAGLTEKLEFSHGCIHIKPSDRDIMVSQGYLQAGVRVITMRYRKQARWGTPPW